MIHVAFMHRPSVYLYIYAYTAKHQMSTSELSSLPSIASNTDEQWQTVFYPLLTCNRESYIIHDAVLEFNLINICAVSLDLFKFKWFPVLFSILRSSVKVCSIACFNDK